MITPPPEQFAEWWSKLALLLFTRPFVIKSPVADETKVVAVTYREPVAVFAVAGEEYG
jgi:hypothetical protein